MNARTAPGFVLDGHWASESEGRGHVVFNAEGIRCANCARSIQRGLGALNGVVSSDVNVVNGRVSVSWDAARTSLQKVLGTVASLGFRPVPLVGEAAALAHRDEQRRMLKRIGLAAIGSMQIMMYAFGLYAGAFDGIDPQWAQLLRITCLIVAAPVLFYSGAPILRGAWHDIRNRTLGMDVTVSAALVLAFIASAINTVRGSGEVYFDSVTMFILFLLLGRWFEMKSRHQAANVTDALARALPATAKRLNAQDQATDVPVAQLHVGDRILIGSGQVIPVDGVILAGETQIDESLVTGESSPQRRIVGSTLAGGALNVGAAVTVGVTREPQDSTLHSLVRLLERAQSERPRLGLAAERMASWFVLRVLILTAIVAAIWAFVDPSRLLPAVLAVLVATCPCALSLATPVVIAAATSRLARAGLLVTRGNAVEGLAHIDTVVLDKTGTLTQGGARLLDTQVLGALDAIHAREIAAALETASNHPVADAFKPFRNAEVRCLDAREVAGAGIEGSIDGRRFRVGTPAFVADLCGRTAPPGMESVMLGDEQGSLAGFSISDELRPEALATIESLQALGLSVRLASGDRSGPVQHVAQALKIESAGSRLTPADKLAYVRTLQSEGHRVLMTGDGINDGPVLAAADVSVAMSQGSAIAHAAGDLLLMRDNLGALPESIRVARQALTIVRQNLRWAAAYNICAIPLAALGLMPPWVAAIGMSCSSLFVVLNARRVQFVH